MTRLQSLRLNTVDGVQSVYQLGREIGRSQTPAAGASRRHSVGTPSSHASAVGTPGRLSNRRPEPLASGRVGADTVGKTEVFEALYKLDSMERGVRMQACNDVFEHVVQHDQAYADILARVKQEYDQDRQITRRERDTLKQSLADLRVQEQKERAQVESLQRDYQQLHATTDSLQAERSQLEEALMEVTRQKEAAEIRVLELESTKQDGAAAAAAVVVHASDQEAELGLDTQEQSAQSESVVLSTRDLAEPTNAEVLGYAVEQLGIDPETEPQLLWIARKALKAKLPDGWGPCASPEGEVRF